jgi:cytoskeletal protein CcmA (bactofilin family)
MFNKTADPTSPPLSRPAMPQGGNTAKSILGSDLRITGEINCSGTVEIMGEIDGNITAAALIVGQEGRVSGSVKAGSVEVKGRLDGKVDSQSFAMRSTSNVAADITYDTLVIESGAQIEGRFTRAKT